MTARIIQLPSPAERKWSWFESEFRRAREGWPDAQGTLDDCLPSIREHWDSWFSMQFTAPFELTIDGPLTDRQRDAIMAAKDKMVDSMVEQFMRTSSAFLFEIANAEYLAAFYRRNGGASPLP